MFNDSRNNPFKWKNKIQYLSDNCGLRVVGYVITPSPVSLFKRIFWLLTTIACCVCSATLLRDSLNLYLTDAVSYSVETNYLEFETPFPAVMICEELNENKVKKYLKTISWDAGEKGFEASLCPPVERKELMDKVHGYFGNIISKKRPKAMQAKIVTTSDYKWNNISLSLSDFVKDVSIWNSNYCKSCLTCKLGHSCVTDFLEMVHGIRKKCTQLLTRCSWNDQTFPCCERFRPIETEYGICYVFNSALTDQGTIYTVNRNTGLPSLTFEAIEKVKIRIHSSDDMVCVPTSVASERVLSWCDSLQLISDFDLILSAEQTISDVSVQRLTPSSRDCLFDHERPDFAHLWPFKRYSYSTCLLYCRAITQAEACNCTHYFLPNIGDIPKCDFEGLICLHKSKDRLGIDKYHCPMSCNEVTYKVVYLTCSQVEEDNIDNRGTIGRVRLAHLPTTRVRRQAIRDLLGVVVDIGGVIGVFFGASLLSFFEIFYLLFIRKYR